MSIPILTDNDIHQELLQDRAGRGRQGYKPGLIVLHIQDDDGDIHNYFEGAYADSTMWNPINGPVTRYLFDTDTAWTDGDWSNPDMTDPAIAHYFNLLNPLGLSSNVIALTVENEGYPSDTMPQAQYNRLVALIAYWCKKWNIPATRDYIVAHRQCGEHKYCPGPIIENHWQQIISDVQATLATSSIVIPPVVPPDAGGVTSVTSVAPGKVDGPGMITEAKRRGDTLMTDESYAIRQPDQSEISFSWGNLYFYFWDALTKAVTSYLKVPAPGSGSTTSIEAEAALRGETLLTGIQTATRKIGGSQVKFAWSSSFVYFWDSITGNATSYRKA